MPTQFPIISSVPTTFNLATYNGVLPNKVTLTGTFTSSGVTVTGTGTLFTTELQSPNWSVPKLYLYNASTGEIRSVKNIIDDTNLILNVAFAVDLAGATLYGVSTSLGRYTRVQIDSTVACTVGKLDLPVATTTANEIYLIEGSDLQPVFAVSVSGASGTVYIGGDLLPGAGGGGVASVTGLDTDNTDPANPVVEIAVDGVTITGDGTSGDPLVASGGSGLATTGLDNGATVQDQVFQNGITVGVASTTDGIINLKNSDDTSVVIINSPDTKELKIDNTGHDVIVGINGAPVAGVAVTVAGNISSGIYLIGDNSANISQVAADQMLLTAADGVSTSAGLTVGGGFSFGGTPLTKNADYTATAADSDILLDSNAAQVYITLPSAAATPGKVFVFTAIDTVNGCRVNDIMLNGGAAAYVFASNYDSIIVKSTGTDWIIIGERKQ